MKRIFLITVLSFSPFVHGASKEQAQSNPLSLADGGLPDSEESLINDLVKDMFFIVHSPQSNAFFQKYFSHLSGMDRINANSDLFSLVRDSKDPYSDFKASNLDSFIETYSPRDGFNDAEKITIMGKILDLLKALHSA